MIPAHPLAGRGPAVRTRHGPGRGLTLFGGHGPRAGDIHPLAPGGPALAAGGEVLVRAAQHGPGLYDAAVKVMAAAAPGAQVRGNNDLSPAVGTNHPSPLSRALFGVVLKVVLDDDDGRALVAAAAGEVAEGADEVGELPRRGALAGHAALEVGVLGAY